MILVLDNYDSFTYNLVQRLGEIDPSVDIRVIRNDKITIGEIRTLKPDRILISPGPVPRRRLALVCPLLSSWRVSIPFLESVWAINPSVKPWGGRLFGRPS